MIAFLLLILLGCHADAVMPKVFECGYKQCPQMREGALNIHLIPHSHMDAGWVKTFDEYYYGTRTSVSSANVQLIYHSVLSELLHDKRRRFTLSETAYFWRWWKEQRPITRNTFRTLVKEGRLEFAGGGWVQNDEATVDYLSIIDQFTWGLRKLNDTLGPCGKPKAAWQIDSYGHTREQASLLAQMGFDGLFIGRVDHKQREAMMDEGRMEFMWRGSDVLGKMSDIMTHTLFNLYNAPDGFCFDFLCTDEPIMDDQESRVYNAGKRVADFILQIERQTKYYDHDNLLVTMGGDFTYQSAANWFLNMDKLINHVNTHPANLSDINIFYSTPSCYLKALYLYGRRDKGMFTEKDDLLPYGSDASTYWTGLYTSRPSMKFLARHAQSFLQIMKQLSVTSQSSDTYELHLLRHAVSLLYHHDTITGTSQQHVINDFVSLVSEAVDACSRKVSNLLSVLTPTWGGSRRSNKNGQQFIVCHQLNNSQCKISESQDSLVVLVYNPSSVKTYHYVRLPVTAFRYSVRDTNDEELENQLVPMVAAAINVPGRKSNAIQELYFEAENIPALGFASYYITPLHDILKESDHPNPKKVTTEPNEPLPIIHNEYLRVTLDKERGTLESVYHIIDGIRLDIHQNFYYYPQGQQTSQSGAYTFRPVSDVPIPLKEKLIYRTIRGTLVNEIHQRFSDWLTQVIRLYRGEDFLEFEWIVGPVPVGSDLGKEVVTRFSTNITNKGTFYTDSNGRQTLKRSCYNKVGNTYQKKPLASCYYPVTSRICIRSLNDTQEMCVLTDRTQGGTSFNEGEIELMIHRRLLTDDGFGLDEPLNEEAHGLGLVVKGKHRIMIGNHKQDVEEQTFSERTSAAARRWQMEPWLFLTSGEKMNRRKWQNVRNKRFSALRPRGLPNHIQILTLEPWKSGSVLLRLENTLETEKIRGRHDPEKASGAEEFPDVKTSRITVDLRKIFMHLKLRAVRETTLAANQWLDEARQMDWSTRYVYSGGDEDIYTEDAIDYGEDNKPYNKNVLKDNVKYSDEDDDIDGNPTQNRNVKRKVTKKSSLRPFSKYKEVIRERRSTDEAERGTNNNASNRTGEPSMTPRNDMHRNKNQLHDKDAENINDTTTDGRHREGSNYNKKKINISRLAAQTNKTVRPKLQTDFYKKVDEEEDDFSEYLRDLDKRKQRRRKYEDRKIAESELDHEEAEDDVTKSIYEMYYKRKPRNHASKQTSRRQYSEEYSEEDNDGNAKRPSHDAKYFRVNERRNNNGYRQARPHVESKTPYNRKVSRRRSSFELDIPLFKAEIDHHHRKKKVLVEEASKEDGKELGDLEMQFAKVQSKKENDRRKGLRPHEEAFQETNEPDYVNGNFESDDGAGDERASYRAKRANVYSSNTHEKVDPELKEEEYMITLRPTQIRTFVVWFESPRKTFSM